MDCKVSASTLHGEITVPPSKSQTLRAILFASLASGTSTIDNILLSTDAVSMIEACRQLGATIEQKGTTLKIKGVAGKIHSPTTPIDAGNSGIVLRFIAAIAALGNTPIEITGDHSICTQRPMQTVLDALSLLGATATSLSNNGYAPLQIQGPLLHATTTVEGKDSQPVSALLILGAFSLIPLEINVEHPGELPWIDLTLSWLDRLKVPYTRSGYTQYKVGGGPPIQGFHYIVPGDMSSAAFAITAAAIRGTFLHVKGIDFDDPQGDKHYFELLEKMGARFERSAPERTLKVLPGSRLHGITADLNNCIDAICMMAVAASFAEGETQITNASIARTKECNRIAALVSELTKMGASIHETTDGLVITGTPLFGAEVWSHNDHRMAMSLAVAGMGATGTTHIRSIDCIQKTYPSFVRDFTNAGALIHEYSS
jgi:3-phosphoshikimate 1-carboxyvinyltransferase